MRNFIENELLQRVFGRLKFYDINGAIFWLGWQKFNQSLYCMVMLYHLYCVNNKIMQQFIETVWDVVVNIIIFF